MMNTVLGVCWLLMLCTDGGSADWTNDRHCGESRYSDAGELLDAFGRIVGGDVARENEFPYQVALYHKTYAKVVCGATLITKYWIVTAAHCVDDTNGDALDVDVYNNIFEIRLGEHDVTHTKSYEKKREAAEIIIHEHYDDYYLYNDIALIRLDRKAGNANGRIRPICRPTAGVTYEDETVVASGWGSLSQHGGLSDLPDVLRYAPLIVTSQAECETDNDPRDVTSSMMCAKDGFYSTDRDTCQGDSGGPLAWKDDDVFQLVGITSWGFGCADGTAGVYTRVSEFLDWIDSKV